MDACGTTASARPWSYHRDKTVHTRALRRGGSCQHNHRPATHRIAVLCQMIPSNHRCMLVGWSCIMATEGVTNRYGWVWMDACQASVTWSKMPCANCHPPWTREKSTVGKLPCAGLPTRSLWKHKREGSTQPHRSKKKNVPCLHSSVENRSGTLIHLAYPGRQSGLELAYHDLSIRLNSEGLR